MMVFATLFLLPSVTKQFLFGECLYFLCIHFFDWKLQISKKENKFQLKGQKHLDDLLI